MYLANIAETFLDYPDNKSLAIIVFLEGCSHNCKGCQSPSLQKPNQKDFISVGELTLKILDYSKRCGGTKKLVLSGGDPYYYGGECKDLIINLNQLGFEICVYTGYTIDKIKELYYNNVSLGPKYIKAGSYREDLRDLASGKNEYEFRLASTNQRFYELVNNEYQQISDLNVLHIGDSK